MIYIILYICEHCELEIAYARFDIDVFCEDRGLRCTPFEVIEITEIAEEKNNEKLHNYNICSR